MTGRECAHCGQPLLTRQQRFCSRICTARHRIETPRPWPLQPLLDTAHLTLDTDIDRLSDIVLANQHDIHDAAVRGLTDIRADRWAIRLGYHPATIWADWFTFQRDTA